MQDERLKNIWKSSTQNELVKFDLSRLFTELNNRMAGIDRQIRARDRREIVAAVIGMAVFGYFAYDIPFPLTKAACGLAIVWFGYVIYKLRSARKLIPPISPDLPFKEQLEQQKMYMLKQKRLLDTVLYWYLLPPFVMNVMFILGLGDPGAASRSGAIWQFLPVFAWEKVAVILIVAAVYAFIFWINWQVVKKTYLPIIDNLEQVKQQLNME